MVFLPDHHMWAPQTLSTKQNTTTVRGHHSVKDNVYDNER